MGDTYIVRMPRLGESVTEGSIVQWLVAIGDHVDQLEPLVTVETDKVEAELPAPVTGVLQEILAEEGSTVDVDSAIAILGTSEG
jgi:pyruvate/2-oxoglutarate dehydrogenase complex dihydrolipoamide acyltransferase (E2) component